jgi:hypothetical protein
LKAASDVHPMSVCINPVAIFGLSSSSLKHDSHFMPKDTSDDRWRLPKNLGL